MLEKSSTDKLIRKDSLLKTKTTNRDKVRRKNKIIKDQNCKK